MAKKKKRDLEKSYPTAEFVAKLRRFADALESGQRFRIQIAGERISVPAGAKGLLPFHRTNGAF